MVRKLGRGTYGGEHPYRPQTLNMPARTRNNANIRIHKHTNAPAPTAAQSPTPGSSHEAAGAAAAATPPMPSIAMAPSPACPSSSVSAAIATPSGSSPAVAWRFDLVGVSSVVPSASRLRSLRTRPVPSSVIADHGRLTRSARVPHRPCSVAQARVFTPETSSFLGPDARGPSPLLHFFWSGKKVGAFFSPKTVFLAQTRFLAQKKGVCAGFCAARAAFWGVNFSCPP